MPIVSGNADDMALTLIYRQRWQGGQGSMMAGDYRSSTKLGGAGAGTNQAPDTVYAEHDVSEAVKITAGIGPNGENALDNDSSLGEDYGMTGIVLEDLPARESGTGATYTSPSGTKWWPAAEGRVLIKSYWNSAAWTEQDGYSVTTATSTPNPGLGYTLAAQPIFPFVTDRYIFRLYYSTYGDTSYFDHQIDSSAFNKTDSVGSVALLNAWQEIEVKYRCGTVTYAGGGTIASVAADGYIQVYLNDVLMIDVQNIAFMMNDGTDFLPDGTNTATYVADLVNKQRSVWLGFYGMFGPQTDLRIYSETSAPALPTAGSQIDNSAPCCGSQGGGGTGATGPVAPPISGNWYRRCTGGGAVPTAEDVEEDVDWSVETPPKEPNTWLTICGRDPEPDERWGLKPLSDSGRFVAGRLEEVSSIERGSSDKDGHYPPARLKVIASDADGTLRDRLADPDRRDLMHREASFELHDYVSRKAGLGSLPLLQGRIVDVQPTLDRKSLIEVQDIVGAQFGTLDPEKTIGVPVGDEHPGKPESSIGRIYPFLLGESSDAGATDSTGASAAIGTMPVVDCGDEFVETTGGSTPDPDGRTFDTGLAQVTDLAGVNSGPGTLTVPTSVRVSAIIGGVMGPPSLTGVLNPNGNGSGGPSDAHSHLQIWMDVPGGADSYIAWLSITPFFHPIDNPTADLNVRYKIISGTPSYPAWPPKPDGPPDVWDFSVDFASLTDGDQWGVQTTSPPLNLAHTINGTPGTTRRVYAVSAITALGESSPCAPLVVTDSPAVLNGTDSVALTWDEPADHPEAVIAYRIEGRDTDPPTAYLAITDLATIPAPLTYTDDGHDAPKLFNAGSGAMVSENVWAWMAAALGEVDIHEVCGSDGAEGDTPKRRVIGWDEGTILGPDSVGWPHADRYRVVGGIRQSGFYTRGLPLKHHREGSVTFAWNGCGWKDDGGLVVDQAAPMLLLLLNELVEKNDGAGYRDGDFGPIELFADGTPKFFTTLFDAYQQQTIDWIGGLGYVGMIPIVEPTPLSEILRRFFVTFGGHGTTTHRGQWYPYLINPVPAAGAGRIYRERMEIARLTDHSFAHTERENRVTYSYHYNFDAKFFRNVGIETKRDASIAAAGGDRIGIFETPVKECFYGNDQATMSDRWERHLDLYEYSPRYVTWATNLKSVPDRNGNPARFSHRKEGLGLNGESGTPGVLMQTNTTVRPYEVIQTAMLFREEEAT
jgi:hypothetical protein